MSSPAPSLRKRAEDAIEWNEENAGEALPSEDFRRLIHELRVHQIELEMQNEELRQTQETLETDRARFFGFYNRAPVGYCTLTLQGVILEANQTTATWLGVSLGMLAKQPLTTFIFPDDQDILYLSRKRLFSTGEPLACDLRMIRSDGTIFWVHLAGNIAQDPADSPVCHVVLSDISERQKTVAELRESRGKLIAALASMTDAVSISDATGTIIDFNEAFAIFHKFKGKEECARYLSDSPGDFPMIMEVFFPDGTLAPLDMWALPRALRGETGMNVQYSLRFKATGETVIGSYNFSPIRNELGNIVGAVVVSRDITNLKKLEKQELDTKLQMANKLESVGRLAGGAAHDFNNMLAVILGNVDWMLTQVDPLLPLHESLTQVRKAATRSSELTNQLLAFSRKPLFHPRLLNLNETVDSTLKMLQRIFGRNISLVWLPGADAGSVNLDPSQIDQILTNLCINARDAISDIGQIGQITIATGKSTLSASRCAGQEGVFPGEFAVLTVSDNGCGMDPETLSRIFEPFFTTKEVGKGTGLGLATVYGIVRQNHGFIDVESQPGKGTTFRVGFPSSPEQENAREAPSRQAPELGRRPSSTEPAL